MPVNRVVQQLRSVWNTVRNRVEVIEDTLRTKRSLRRFLETIAIEPFFLDPPSVLNGEWDLVEAIYEAMRRGGLTHIRVSGWSHAHPANAVWATVEKALTELVSSWIDCGQRMLSIRNIDEISASKTAGPFKSIREFGAHVAQYHPCSTTADFQKAVHHSFPVGKRFTIVYRAWTGRYRWYNQDGSHHAALAQWYAHTHDQDFRFTADLYQQMINHTALDALCQTTIRSFLLPIEGMPTKDFLRLIDFQVPFQTLSLRIHGKERKALLIYPGTNLGRIAADVLLNKLKHPGGELTATLSRVFQHQRLLPTAS
jgi:hypothetical protein